MERNLRYYDGRNIILILKNGEKFKAFVDATWGEDECDDGSGFIVEYETGIKECYMFSSIEDIIILD